WPLTEQVFPHRADVHAAEHAIDLALAAARSGRYADARRLLDPAADRAAEVRDPAVARRLSADIARIRGSLPTAQPSAQPTPAPAPTRTGPPAHSPGPTGRPPGEPSPAPTATAPSPRPPVLPLPDLSPVLPPLLPSPSPSPSTSSAAGDGCWLICLPL
ncbi:MAG TPA: hypothetical protein VGD43_03410, partial [Micromonospora sp.]